MTVQELLSKIQRELEVPKNQWNKHGNYNYRSCEDILREVKKMLGAATLRITDNIEQIGERYYVKATVSLCLGEESISSTSFARECLTRKGMDESQITGAASSYARKYALNALFGIDDTKDTDNTNKHNKDEKKKAPEGEPDGDITKEMKQKVADIAKKNGYNSKDIVALIGKVSNNKKSLVFDLTLQEYEALVEQVSKPCN